MTWHPHWKKDAKGFAANDEQEAHAKHTCLWRMTDGRGYGERRRGWQRVQMSLLCCLRTLAPALDLPIADSLLVGDHGRSGSRGSRKEQSAALPES